LPVSPFFAPFHVPVLPSVTTSQMRWRLAFAPLSVPLLISLILQANAGPQQHIIYSTLPQPTDHFCCWQCLRIMVCDGLAPLAHLGSLSAVRCTQELCANHHQLIQYCSKIRIRSCGRRAFGGCPPTRQNMMCPWAEYLSLK
jgi:hypothetical protein